MVKTVFQIQEGKFSMEAEITDLLTAIMLYSLLVVQGI